MSAYGRTVEVDLTNPLGKGFHCIGRAGQELKSKESFDFDGWRPPTGMAGQIFSMCNN